MTSPQSKVTSNIVSGAQGVSVLVLSSVSLFSTDVP